MHLINIRTACFTQQKEWGLYQNKVNSSLAAIKRPGHQADNCKMVYYRQASKINMFTCWTCLLILTLCWKVSWFSGSRLNHRAYTILEYNPAISTMAATTMIVQIKTLDFCSHSLSIHTQPFMPFNLKNNGIWTVNAKIQEPGMITWDRKT